MKEVDERADVGGGAPRKPRTSRPAFRRRDELVGVGVRQRRDPEAASPISSASTPPGPNATSGPKTGSCTIPASSSAPPCEHRLDDHRGADPLAAGRTASASARSRATPPTSVLCMPGAADLTTAGKPSSRAAAPARRRRRRGARGRAAAPYARGARASSPGRASRRPRRASARSTTALRAARSMPASSGTDAGRPPEPLGALGGTAERPRGRLRVRERGDARSRRAAPPGCPSALITTASIGLSRRGRSRPRARPPPRPPPPRPSPPGRRARSTASTCGSAEHQRQRLLRRLGRRRAEHVDRVGDARLGRQQRAQALAVVVGRARGSSRPAAVARVGAEDPEPARVREHGDAPAARLAAGVERASRRRAAPPATPRGSRRPGGTARRRPPPSPRGRPCASWRPAPAAVVPLLSARIGLRRATRRARRPNLRGLPNDSRYSSTSSVSSSSSHHSSRSFVETSALFPIETKAERPSPRDAAASSSASPSAPLWEEKPMLPRGAGARARTSRSGAAPATAMPRQFGPTSRAPWARTSASSCSCALGALAPDLGEAGRDHDERAHAVRSASSAASSTAAPGNARSRPGRPGRGISAQSAYAADARDGSPSRLTG